MNKKAFYVRDITKFVHFPTPGGSGRVVSRKQLTDFFIKATALEKKYLQRWATDPEARTYQTMGEYLSLENRRLQGKMVKTSVARSNHRSAILRSYLEYSTDTTNHKPGTNVLAYSPGDTTTVRELLGAVNKYNPGFGLSRYVTRYSVKYCARRGIVYTETGTTTVDHSMSYIKRAFEDIKWGIATDHPCVQFRGENIHNVSLRPVANKPSDEDEPATKRAKLEG
jgi:hypothetical protein